MEQYLSEQPMRGALVSKTTYYQKTTMQLSTKQLEHAAEEAHAIIDDISEMFPIKELARVIIDEFKGLLDEDLSLQERIDTSIQLAREQRSRYPFPSWQFQCASRLAERTLILAGRIVKRKAAHSKAVEELNHIVESRNRKRDQRMAKHRSTPTDVVEFSREPRDGRQGSKPSPKQQPQRRHTERRTQRPVAQRRRRAA